MSNDEFLPEKIHLSVAYGAMIHFLIDRYNNSEASEDVRRFVEGFFADSIGQPASDLLYDRFKEAVVDADRMEQLPLLKSAE